jgi:hypothetical protein
MGTKNAIPEYFFSGKRYIGNWRYHESEEILFSGAISDTPSVLNGEKNNASVRGDVSYSNSHLPFCVEANQNWGIGAMKFPYQT